MPIQRTIDTLLKTQNMFKVDNKVNISEGQVLIGNHVIYQLIYIEKICCLNRKNFKYIDYSLLCTTIKLSAVLQKLFILGGKKADVSASLTICWFYKTVKEELHYPKSSGLKIPEPW